MSLTNFSREKAPVVKMELVKLTPFKAGEFLKDNCDNRTVSSKHVDTLVHELKSGHWQTNGDAIRFDVNGHMIDGQHRCLAVLESGISIEVFVISGLPTEAFSTIDSGKCRTGSGTLSATGMDHSTTVASALRLVDSSSGYSSDWNGIEGNKAKLTNDDFLEMAESYTNVVDAAARIHLGDRKFARKLLTQSQATFVLSWLSLIDEADAEQFFEWIEYGENLDRDHPVALLRAKLIELTGQKVARNKPVRRHTLAMVFRAWNAVREGTPMKRIGWQATSTFPTPR